MTFDEYKKFALTVFPELSETLNTMSDVKLTHELILSFCIKSNTDAHVFDLLSLKNMAETQIRHLEQFGETFWHTKSKKK